MYYQISTSFSAELIQSPRYGGASIDVRFKQYCPKLLAHQLTSSNYGNESSATTVEVPGQLQTAIFTLVLVVTVLASRW